MADIKTLDLLKSQLEVSRPADGRLIMTPANVPDGDFLNFLQTLPQQQLVLENPQFTTTGSPAITRLDVTGQVYGTWMVPYVNGAVISGIEAKITFLQSRPATAILSAFMVTQASLSINGKPVPVSGQLLPSTTHVSFTVLSSPQGQQVQNALAFSLSNAISFLTNARYQQMAPQGVPLFDQIRLSGMQLQVGFGAAPTLFFGVNAEADGNWQIIDGGVFALTKIGIALLAKYQPSKSSAQQPSQSNDALSRPSFGGNIYATTRIGNADFDLILYLSDRDRWEFDLIPKGGQALPALLDLAAYIGGDALHSTVQTGLQKLGLGQIVVDGVGVAFDLPQRKLLSMTLRGHIMVAGGQVNLIVQLPDFTFYGGLPYALPGSTTSLSRISVKSLASEILGEPADMPELYITEMSLFAEPSQGAYTISVLTEEDWKWDLSGKGSGPALTLEKLGFNVEKLSQGVNGGLAVVLNLGGFELSLSAQYQGKGAGWLFTGSGSQQHSVPLGAFIQDAAQKIGASVPAALLQSVQGLEINNVSLVLDSHTKSFQFTADTTTKGQLPLGLKTYQLDTRAFLSSDVDSSGRRSFTGHLEADLDVGESTFVVSFDFGPNVKTITGQWRSTGDSTIGFNDLADLLGIEHTISLPQGLDLGLKSASFKYQVDDKNFTLAAESSKFGDAFFTAGESQSGGWGFVFGVDFPPKSKLSSLPVIGDQLKAADFLSFQQFAVLLSSATLKNYSLPILPPLPAPPPSATTAGVGRLVSGRSIKPVATGTSLQLSPGLSLVAILDFAASGSDKRTANLGSIVGQNTLPVQVTLGESGVSLFTALSGSVGIPTGKSKLALSNPSLLITLTTEVVFQLLGTMSFTVIGTKIVATARLIIDESEAQVAVDISGDHGSLPAPPGVKGLHLLDFGIAMGVFFEPPGVDLGVQGKFKIGDLQGNQDDQFAIVLEIVEEIPNLLYLAFYVDQLDLGQAVTLFTNQSAPDMIKSLEIVKLSDVGFHWAENVVVLPDGSIAQPGFGFSASIQIFSFGAHADLQVGATTGIQGHAEMSPINLKNILQITGAGKGMFRTYQKINGQWQLVANNNVVTSRPAPQTQRETIVPPGGPVIDINSFHSPFIHVNWQVTLFDLEKTSVDVTVADTGFSFALTYQLAGIEKFTLNARLQDASHFNGSAEFHFGIDASIGPIHVLGINCGSLHLVATMDAGMEIALDSSRFSMGIHGGFNFQGLSFSMPTLTLTVAPASLKELPGKILQQIKDHADQIFAALFGDVQKWANMIGHGVVVGVTDMARALKDAYKVTAQDAARLMKTANQAGATVAAGLKAVYGLSSDGTTAAMKAAGYAARDVASGLKQAYGLTDQAAVTALKGAGYAVNDVAGALRTAFGETPQRAAQLLKAAGYTVQDVGSALRSAYGAAEQQAAKVLHSIGYGANDVGNALKSAYGGTAQGAAEALRLAGYGASETGNTLKSVYGQTADQAAKALHGAGYAVNDAGNALKSVYGASANAAASALKSAGYAVDETGNFLKSAYNLGSDQLKGALNGAGYAADQVGNFFGSAGGAVKHFFDSIF